MKGILKFVIIVIIFLLIGESVTRLDGIYKPFDTERNQVRLKQDIKETAEYKLLNENRLQILDSDFRAMTIGDSFIHGGGIDFRNNTSNQLKKLIEVKQKSCGESYMLDLSRPGNNTLDNYNTFMQFYATYQPNVVLIGYTLRDVLGPMNKNDLISKSIAENDDDIEIVAKQTVDKGIYKIINPLRRNSYLFRYINNSIQRELKIRGIVIPNLGSFHYATSGAYSDNNQNWINSKNLFEEMANKCAANNSLLIVYYLPEFNVLEHSNLFKKVNPKIDSFFETLEDIVYINGLSSDFKNSKSEDYYISKYDAHPNEKAHLKIANTVFNAVNNNLLICENFKSDGKY